MPEMPSHRPLPVSRMDLLRTVVDRHPRHQDRGLQRNPDAEEPEAPVVEIGVVDRRHPAPVVVERLVIAPAVIDAAPALIGRRWAPGRVVVPRPRATWAARSTAARSTTSTLAAGRGPLIVPSGRGPLVVSALTARAARPLAVTELARLGARLGACNPATEGQDRCADRQCDRGTAGQLLEIHDQPPFAVVQSQMFYSDCRRLWSEAMRELWPV